MCESASFWAWVAAYYFPGRRPLAGESWRTATYRVVAAVERWVLASYAVPAGSSLYSQLFSYLVGYFLPLLGDVAALIWRQDLPTEQVRARIAQLYPLTVPLC
jgi:hypothetical protein